MITSLKIFESSKKEKFWKVPCRGNYTFLVALFKIGVPLRDMAQFIYDKDEEEHDAGRHFDFVLVFEEKPQDFTWDIFSTDIIEEYIESNKFDYMGEVTVDDEDRERYEIGKEAKKFNL